MNSLFEIVWFGWFLSELLLNRFFRSKINKSKDTDKNSLRWIWLAIMTSLPAGVFITFYLKSPISASGWTAYAGLLVIVLGVLIRFVAIRTLGKFFTVDLSIHSEHTLIKKGLYKYIRHPSYTGSLLSFLGMGLSLNNWISLMVIFVPVFAAFVHRMNIEERLLLDQTGLEYEKYKRSTKRLIPLIY